MDSADENRESVLFPIFPFLLWSFPSLFHGLYVLPVLDISFFID
jgi:hypothetical protein